MSKGSEAPRVRLGYGGGGPLTGESAATIRATIWRLFGYARPYSVQLIMIAVLVMIKSFAGKLFGTIPFSKLCFNLLVVIARISSCVLSVHSARVPPSSRKSCIA